jgi:hypothetical protein
VACTHTSISAALTLKETNESSWNRLNHTLMYIYRHIFIGVFGMCDGTAHCCCCCCCQRFSFTVHLFFRGALCVVAKQRKLLCSYVSELLLLLLLTVLVHWLGHIRCVNENEGRGQHSCCSCATLASYCCCCRCCCDVIVLCCACCCVVPSPLALDSVLFSKLS